MAAPILDARLGLIMTLEESAFRETDQGRLSDEIDDGSVGKIKRAGADAVKALAWYRPDAPGAVNEHQKAFTRKIGEECVKYDIPYLFELLVYPLPGEEDQTTDYTEMAEKKSELVLESIAEFAKPEYHIDVFKLESPVPARDCDGSDKVQALFDEMGRLAGRPWVMLSAGAGMAEFRNVLTHAYRAGASGYLAGRAIWSEAFKAFPDWEAIRIGLAGASAAYMKDINGLTDRGRGRGGRTGAAARWPAPMPISDTPIRGSEAERDEADPDARARAANL